MPTTTDLTRAAECFRALADETRLAIALMLQEGGRCVCELQDELDVAQPLLSFHLRVLKDAHLVSDRREGRWVYYSLNADALADLREVLGELKPARQTASARRRSACCD